MSHIKLLVYPAVALLSLAAAITAHAESPTPDDTSAQVWTQTKTRAQVQAELLAARADGSIKFSSTSYNPLATMAMPTQTRADVRARTSRSAPTANYTAALVGEDSGSFYLSQQVPAARVAPVYAGQPTSGQ